MNEKTVRVFIVDMSKILVAIGACKSRSEAKRLIKQKAVLIDGETAGRMEIIRDGAIVRCGKHFFMKLVNTDETDKGGIVFKELSDNE